MPGSRTASCASFETPPGALLRAALRMRYSLTATPNRPRPEERPVRAASRRTRRASASIFSHALFRFREREWRCRLYSEPLRPREEGGDARGVLVAGAVLHA